MIFALTIAVSARFFGLGPSLLASALSIMAMDLVIFPPLGHKELQDGDDVVIRHERNRQAADQPGLAGLGGIGEIVAETDIRQPGGTPRRPGNAGQADARRQ